MTRANIWFRRGHFFFAIMLISMYIAFRRDLVGVTELFGTVLSHPAVEVMLIRIPATVGSIAGTSLLIYSTVRYRSFPPALDGSEDVYRPYYLTLLAVVLFELIAFVFRFA